MVGRARGAGLRRSLTRTGVALAALTVALSLSAPSAGAAPTPAGPTPPPAVTKVAPAAGSTAGGTTVTISGTHLTGATQVLFGAAAAATVTVVSDKKITAVSPSHSAGAVDVTVTNDIGTSPVVTADVFTFATPLTVTGVSPASGSTSGGPTVTVSGTGLTGATAVTFGSTAAADLVVLSDSSLTVTAPAHAAGTIDVRVTTPAGTSTVTTADRYVYVSPPPPPSVTKVAPVSGPSTGGTTVTVSGTHFTGATQVSFGAVAATTMTVVSDSKITAKSPAQGAGPVDVTVTTPNGNSAAGSADTFTYTAPPVLPVVTGVSPASGPVAGGTSVTVTGTGFTGATGVAFGASAGADVVVVSDTSVTVTAPAHAAGAIDVRVTTPTGSSAVGTADKFTYVSPPPPPTVTKVAPTSGPAAGGTTVTITGAHLTGATQVWFGAAPASGVTVLNDAKMTAISPAGAAGPVDVSVATAAGTSAVTSSDTFTYTAPPVKPAVTGVSPASGPTVGGTTVTVTGTAFTGVTSVTFGATPGTSVTVLSSTSLTVVSPAHGASAIDIKVTTAAGTSAIVNIDKFVYNDCGVAPVHASGTLTANTTWGPTCASIYLVDGNLDVPAGVTLTIQPGTLVKVDGATIFVEGTLNAIGSASKPILLTSINDNVGGGTNGTGSPAAGDWGGIIQNRNNAVVHLDHTTVQYGQYGVSVRSPGVTLTNDTFTHLSGPAVWVGNISGPVTLTPDAWFTGNQATDDGLDGIVVTSALTLSDASTWTTRSTWALVLDGPVDVPAGLSLTIQAGSVVKFGGGPLTVEGTLTSAGTPASPVVLTSINDNSSGATTGTGSPAPGDWAGISVTANSSLVNLRSTGVRYATTAVSAVRGATTVRGDLTHNVADVAACDWGGSCTVDAAYTAWGSDSGPGTSGATPDVCGAVTISPWLTSAGTASAPWSSVLDCDGSSATADVTAAAAAYDNAVATDTSDCTNGTQAACDAVTAAQSCVSSARAQAANDSPFPLPSATPTETAADYTTDLLAASDTYLTSNEETTVPSFTDVVQYAGDITRGVDEVLSTAATYQQCQPPIQ